jgi:hypothetical protein
VIINKQLRGYYVFYPLSAQVGNRFADKRWSLGRYSSLVDSDHGVIMYFKILVIASSGLVVRVSGYRSRGPRFDSWGYQIFCVVVSLERGPLSVMSTIKELLDRNSSSSSLESREYGRGEPLRWTRDTLYPQKLALTLLTSSGRLVSIVHSQTKATVSFLVIICICASQWSMQCKLMQ